ncbi:MAG TPA: hypothetical protein VM367_04515 [Pseudonocardia sp.]|nr:hypothetical protein [Pseudonocardia sp.]
MPASRPTGRFRLFGRSARPPAPVHRGPAGPFPGVPPYPGSARPGSARPGARHPHEDPLTDPFGFPPVPAPAPPAPVRPSPAPPVAGPARPDPAEAGALAAAFAADYLSWDEDDPGRRGRVLTAHLSAPVDDPAHLGWSGQGRQRADFALPGLVRPDGAGRVLVDVRVRVTPYRPVGEHGDTASEPEADVAGVPAAAPAPTARGWRSLASCWIRLTVPVVAEGGRLVVDAWEEALGADAPSAAAPAPVTNREDHVLDDDGPDEASVTERSRARRDGCPPAPSTARPGGAW